MLGTRRVATSGNGKGRCEALIDGIKSNFNVLMFLEEGLFCTKTDFFTTSRSVAMETIGNFKK